MGTQVRPDFFAGNATSLLIVDEAVTSESEPNDDATKPQSVNLPLVVSGRFDQPRDADWYELETGENGQYAFEVYCERIAGRADPYLVVMDDQGKRVAELDDYGHRINAFDGHLRDPSGMVNLNANRKYRVLVQDRYRRGGPRYQYVLKVRKPRPDFYPAVIHSDNPGPAGTTIWQGGARYLDVVIHQSEGFNGPITFSAEGLPPGLHSAPTTIFNTNRGTFVFWADKDAPEWTGTVKLFATGKRGEKTIRREVRPYTKVWTDAGMNSSRPTRELALAIRPSAPFAMEFEKDVVEVAAGEKAEVKLRLTRHGADFKNEVTVLGTFVSRRIQSAQWQIRRGVNKEITLTIDVQNGRPPGDYTLAVLGQAQVPFNKDAAAKSTPQHAGLSAEPTVDSACPGSGKEMTATAQLRATFHCRSSHSDRAPYGTRRFAPGPLLKSWTQLKTDSLLPRSTRRTPRWWPSQKSARDTGLTRRSGRPPLFLGPIRPGQSRPRCD